MRRTPKHILQAHKLITGRDRLTRKAHGKAEYNQLVALRDLFKDRNIVGLGVAEKRSEGKRTGDLALCFYVTRKAGKKRLGSHKMIPPVISIGGGKAIFTDVHEMRSRFKALANFQQSPVQSGFSVGTEGDVHAGTMGAIVSFGTTKYMLSNSHVFEGLIDITQISFPAREDNGNKPNLVGILRHKVELVSVGNRADAALAEIDKSVTIKADIIGAKVPYEVGIAEDKMRIIGFGRTSGTIRGVVRTTDFDGGVEMPDGKIIDFVDQVACTGSADKGDSGAIMVSEDTKQIVGILFAASNTEFMFTPIAAARKELGVNFSFVDP